MKKQLIFNLLNNSIGVSFINLVLVSIEVLFLYKLEAKFNTISNIYMNIFVIWMLIFVIIIFNTSIVFLFNLVYLKKLVLKNSYISNSIDEKNTDLNKNKEKKFKLKRKSIKT